MAYISNIYRFNKGGYFLISGANSGGALIRLYDPANNLIYWNTLNNGYYQIGHLNRVPFYCGIEYTIRESTSSGEKYLATYTTPPSRPKITSVAVNYSSVTVGWALEDIVGGGRWTKIYINLYNVNDQINFYKTQTVYASSVNYNTSGAVTFTDVADGEYIIKAQTILVVNDTEIPCCKEYLDIIDKAYGSDSIFTYISEPFKAGRSFKWTYAYVDNDDNVILGETKEMVQGQKYLYVAATEWNELCDYVKQKWSNEWYTHYPIGDNPYGYATTTTMKEVAEDAKVVSGEEMSARKFNLIRYCIGSYPEMESTGLSDFSRGDDIKIGYFNILKDKANQMN